MCSKNINLQYKTIFTNFGQNTAEFSLNGYFRPEFWCKQHNLALHLTKTEKFKTKNIVHP